MSLEDGSSLHAPGAPVLRGERRLPEAARERFAPSCGTVRSPLSEEQMLDNAPLGVWFFFFPRFRFLKRIQWQKITFLLLNWNKPPVGDAGESHPGPSVPWRSLHAAGGVWVTRRSQPAQWTVMDQALGASGCRPSWRGWSQHQPDTAPAAAPARCNLPCAALVPTSGSSLAPSGGDQSLLGAFAASGSAPGVAEPQLGSGRRAAGGRQGAGSATQP